MIAMTPDEWQALAGSSGWSAMKRYLLDSRANIMEAIAEGSFKDTELHEAIFRCQNLKDLAEMDYKTIKKFYGIPDDTDHQAKDAK